MEMCHLKTKSGGFENNCVCPQNQHHTLLRHINIFHVKSSQQFTIMFAKTVTSILWFGFDNIAPHITISLMHSLYFSLSKSVTNVFKPGFAISIYFLQLSAKVSRASVSFTPIKSLGTLHLSNSNKGSISSKRSF